MPNIKTGLRRQRCRLLAVAFACLFGTASFAESPNIVVILADDLGFGDLSYNNADSKIETPVLDQLAKEGINFTDAHSPSGVCTPTRYGLLTGRYCWRSRLKCGVLSASSPPLIKAERLTLRLEKHRMSSSA